MARHKSSAARARVRRKRAAKDRTGHRYPRAVDPALTELAHEIRTPLTGILSMAELLASSQIGERERSWANAIRSTAEHLALLTTLIVDAARAESKGLLL